jgi:anti-sigma factor RsiW
MGRVVPLHGDEHEHVQSLLPWYANRTLDADEAEHVRVHLAGCPQCTAELAWQERLRTAAPSAPPAAMKAEVDRQWAALSQRLERPAAARPAVAKRDWLSARWWPLALGVQSALVAALALVWVLLPAHDEPYRALGGAPAATTANVLVVFRPNATEADIRRALRANRAQVVAGPTVTDAYLLRMDPLTSQTLARLRGDATIVRVESLEAQAQ